jgi:hypothetical protein
MHGPDDYDRTQRLVVNYAYGFPDYHQARGLAGKTLSNWAVSGVTVIQRGQPMTLTDPTGGAILGFTGITSVAQLCPGATYADLLTPAPSNRA